MNRVPAKPGEIAQFRSERNALEAMRIRHSELVEETFPSLQGLPGRVYTVSKMLRRSGYKHYQNRGQSGDRIFVTTTVLDFVEVFKSPKLADLFTEMLFESHQSAGATLHSFVVMSHHVHFLTTLPPNQDAPRFVGALKSQSARAIRTKIDPDIERAFDEQRGLDGRMFWQRSFRSYTILRNVDFQQKLRYIHLNPVRAGLCEYPEQYRWLSASLVEAQLWFPEESIQFEDWLRLAPAPVA